MNYRKTYAARIDELNYRIETAFGYRFGEFDKLLKTPDTFEEYDEFRFAYDFDNDTLKTPNKPIAQQYMSSKEFESEPEARRNPPNRAEIEDDILEYLIFAYTDGINAVNEMLTSDVKVNEDKLFLSLEKKTAGKTCKERLDEHLANDDIEGVKRVAETEFHRVFNDALEDGGADAGAKTKRWETMEDDKVRDTHSFLQGVTIPFKDKFHTYDGDSALAPSGFEYAENNVNCRCYIELSY